MDDMIGELIFFCKGKEKLVAVLVRLLFWQASKIHFDC